MSANPTGGGAAPDGGDEDGGGGGVDAIWANSAFDQDDEDGDGEDTRSPLRATPAAAAAAADASAPAAPAPPPPPQQQQEIPEATLAMLEAVAYAVPFADFCERLEATRATRGAAAKRDAMFFKGEFEARLTVREASQSAAVFEWLIDCVD